MLSGDLLPVAELHLSIDDINSQSRVIEVFSLNQIDPHPSISGKEIRFVLDIDDTIFTHGWGNEFFSIGSKAWRADVKIQIGSKLQEWIAEDAEIQAFLPMEHSIQQITQNLHDYLTWFLGDHLPMRTIEPGTAAFIQNLQAQGVDVTFCTAREQNVWYFLKGLHYGDEQGLPVASKTMEQLHSVGIQLAQEPLAQSFTTEFYERGIHYSPHDLKGDYFKEHMLFSIQASGFDGEYVFIDDKHDHAQSMAKAFGEGGIPARSYHYRAAEAVDSFYDRLTASVQLYVLWGSKGADILTNQQAKDLAGQYPDRDAEWYLKSVVLDVLRAYYGPVIEEQ